MNPIVLAAVVAERGDKRDYIQSAFRIYDQAKLEQETKLLRSVSDSFRILVEEDDFPPYYDGYGIYISASMTS